MPTRARALASPRLALAVLASSFWAPPPVSGQEDAFSLEGLVVTTSPLPRTAEEVSAHVTVLSAEELEPYGDRSLGEVLRVLAGVDVVRNGSFGSTTSAFVRGGESDYTLVLVDGVQVNLPGGGFDFASLTTDNVERIEIVRGPASALYGSDAVTGVVHVVTRTGRGPPRGSLSARTGSFGRVDWAADLTAGTERAGYAVSLARRTGDGIAAFNNRHESTVLSGRARLLPDERTEVGLTLRLTDSEYHFPTDGSGALVDRNAFTFSDAALLQVTARRALTPDVSLGARVGLSEIDGGTDDRPDGPADTLGFYAFSSLDDFQRATAELRVDWTVAGLSVSGGFEAERERQRSFTESLSEFGPSHGRSGSERTNRGAFAHLAGSRGPTSVTLGGRLEDNDRFGRTGTWQAGVSWLAPSRLRTRVRASIGTAIKEPTFFENFATGFAVGNPDLDPERARSWEVGLEQPLADGRVVARATYFDQRFEDLIQFAFAPPDPAGPSYFNVAEASSRGVELDVEARLSPVSLHVSRTWLDTEVLDAGFDSGSGATFVEGEGLLRRPRATWALRAAVDLARAGRVFARLSAVGARADRDFSTFPATPVTLDGYASLAVGLEWTLRGAALPEVTLSALGENLLDQAYEEVLGFPAPGRGLYVGARVALGGRGGS